MLQSLNSGVKQCVLVDGERTDYVPTYQGVRQGCPISPLLFSIFIDEMVESLLKTKTGVTLGARRLRALLYADDAVLIAGSVDELQVMMGVVDRFCKKWRMALNLRKSEAMVVPAQFKTQEELVPDGIFIRGVPVDLVSKYKYLGIWIQNDLSWAAHVDHAVSKAKQKHASIIKVLTTGGVPTLTKLMVWKAVVRARLEYSGELVQLNQKQTDNSRPCSSSAAALTARRAGLHSTPFWGCPRWRPALRHQGSSTSAPCRRWTRRGGPSTSFRCTRFKVS